MYQEKTGKKTNVYNKVGMEQEMSTVKRSTTCSGKLGDYEMLPTSTLNKYLISAHYVPVDGGKKMNKTWLLPWSSS